MTFAELVNEKYDNLSKSHKKIARFLLDNNDGAVFEPLSKLSERAQTSEATLVRFAVTMGFTGYGDMQSHFRDELFYKLNSPSRDAGRFLFDEQLDKFYAAIEPDKIRSICDMLMLSGQVLVIGYVDSLGVSAELFHMLFSIRPGVNFGRFVHISSWDDMLMNMSDDSCVLAVSFSPHYKFTFDCVCQAKNRGMKVITICDSELNPYRELSDRLLCFDAPLRGAAFRDKTLVMHFVGYLTDKLYEYYKDDIIKNRAMGEQRFEQFIE